MSESSPVASFVRRAAGSAGRLLPGRSELASQSRQFARLLVVGLAVGFVAFLLHETVSLVEHFTLHRLIGLEIPKPAREAHAAPIPPAPPPDASHPAVLPHGDPAPPRASRWLFLIPAVGGLVVGLLTLGLAPDHQGDGTDVAIRAYHHRSGYMPASVTLRKLLASVVTVGTGGSSGLEGPIAQGGAGVGSWLADRWGAAPPERRRLAVAGMAAGVGAIFRAPLGGAIYAVEVLYRDSEFESESLIPAFIAGIISYSVYCTISGRGWGALFAMPELTFDVPLLLIYYLVMAVALALLGGVYVKAYEACRFLFRARRWLPGWARPMAGGLALGLLAMQAPYVLGSGYGYLQGALDGDYTLRFLVMMGLLKIVATSLTLGSGGAGGAFAPSLVIGGMIGGAFGVVGQKLGIVEHAAPMILVGMAGFFAGVSKAPVAALIMVSEMTFGYGLLVPLMLVTGVTYVLVPRRLTMHHSQPATRRDSPVHHADYVSDILRELRVADLLPRGATPPLVPLDTPLAELNLIFTRTQHAALPVVDEEEELAGVVLLDDIREHLLAEEGFAGLILAADLMRHDLEPIRRGEDASTALGRLLAADADELPVVEEEAPTRVVGTLARGAVLAAYHERMRALTRGGAGA